MFAKKLFKTMNDKQITVFIAIKRRSNFSIINYRTRLICCSLKAKSIFQVSKIYKGGQLFGFECMDMIEVLVLAKSQKPGFSPNIFIC